MRIRIFKQLDPRENRLPADTSHIVQQKPHRTLPLVNPDRFVQNNPAVSAQIAKFDPVNPKAIRADARARIQRMVDEANRMIQNSIQFKTIRFDVDQDSGRYVAVVRDRRSGQVLRQIPSDQILNMAARLKTASGLFKDITI
jgi:flagellar protein FlaG